MLQFPFLPAVVLFCAALIASAAPDLHRRTVVHEKRDVTPPAWKIHRQLDKNTYLPFKIGLKQSNMDRLEEYLMDVSHPSSPNYGQHWSPEKVLETFKPSSESVDTVFNWLQESGFEAERMQLSKSQGWIEMKLTVEEAEQLLDAEYFIYEHVNGHQHIGETHAFYSLFFPVLTRFDRLRVLLFTRTRPITRGDHITHGTLRRPETATCEEFCIQYSKTVNVVKRSCS